MESSLQRTHTSVRRIYRKTNISNIIREVEHWKGLTAAHGCILNEDIMPPKQALKYKSLGRRKDG
jgi:hypothetical protein